MRGAVNRLNDEKILMALHLVENMGLSHRQAGDVVGMTKNACIGAINRVRNEKTGVHSIISDLSNKDGSQPTLWWFDPTSSFGQTILLKLHDAMSK